MSIFVVTLLVMGLFVVMMAVGVIMGKDPLKGSCGGLNKIGIDGKCEICGREPEEACGGKAKMLALPSPQVYDAMKKRRE